MMVVMVVSRRVGQVTLAVSLRTSCRNLNGLKAIVWSRPLIEDFGIQNSPIAPNPHLEGEPQRGLDCPGMKKAAPEIRKRAGSRWRYVLWSKRKVKAHRLRQNHDARIGRARKSLPVEAFEAHGR